MFYCSIYHVGRFVAGETATGDRKCQKTFSQINGSHMGRCGGAGWQSPKTLHSSFTQFCDYFQATVPSECHMKNIFSLSNYPFKCEAQCSEAHGDCLVNMLTAVSNPFLFEGKSQFQENFVYKRSWGYPHPKNSRLVMSTGYEFPVLNTTPPNLWWPVDECGESSDSSLRLQMFLLAQTCSFSNFQYVHSLFTPRGNQGALNYIQWKQCFGDYCS